ncbi:MAG TPA: GAF domain-containing protein [Terriglobales bacterium]|nr:GAF domain-containing protein [Terriglobales bacterium]
MESLVQTAVLVNPAELDSLGPELQFEDIPAAMLEFQVSLQLLIQRAQFLTAASSAALAIEEDGEFAYCAVVGDSGIEVGTTADLSQPSIERCLKAQKAVCMDRSTQACASLTVPIIREGKVAGFFELLSEAAFEASDLEAIGRLAEVVTTAIDHREAALQVENGSFEHAFQATSAFAPKLWHAPELDEEDPSPLAAPAVPIFTSASVEKCASCGFPVSTGRKLCVDCEQKTETVHEPAELFSTPEHESWIRAHGYTIASLFVTGAAVALILWLR